MNLNYQEFMASAKPGKRIPLMKTLKAATLSPVAMVEALGLENQQFALLESGKGGEKLASHTFICYAPSLVYRTKGNEVTVNAEQVTGVHPYRYLEGLLQHYPAEKIAGMPKFAGGAVGFISYD
ncbi:MAG TPA: hypothetical protein VNU93_04785, partial [Verrucomicrobiae bacterium]|nr:hypothetical protein [Verrucomicrobiae bacterium]